MPDSKFEKFVYFVWVKHFKVSAILYAALMLFLIAKAIIDALSWFG